MIKTNVREERELKTLKPHPRNYRGHPVDQKAHLRASLKAYGFYKNIVITPGGVILAGHGITEAAIDEGIETGPVIVLVLDIDPESPAALKIVAGDNEIGGLAEVDDRLLTEILKEIGQSEIGLLGTGFDDATLANLIRKLPNEPPLSGSNITIKPIFEVIVVCSDETQQRQLYAEFTERKLSCKVLTL